MTSSNESISRVTGPLCGEFTDHRWIPHTNASDAELWCFLWSAPWINGWVNNREAGDLRRHRAHYDVIVMVMSPFMQNLGLCVFRLPIPTVNTVRKFVLHIIIIIKSKIWIISHCLWLSEQWYELYVFLWSYVDIEIKRERERKRNKDI